MTTIYYGDILKVSTKEAKKANIHQSDESTRVRNDPTATKGDITVRLVPPADHIVHIDTPAVTAIIRKDATDAEHNSRIDRPALTAYLRVRVPQGHETYKPYY